MPRKVIQPKTLNDPRARYSQGISNSGGKLLFVAGQTASDKDGNVVGKGDIKAQTRQVFDNLRAVLKATGGTLDNLVMTTTYITGRGWLYDPKNKEESLAIHMKVLKSTRESADEDYKYLVQDFQPFPKDGTVGKVSFDKTMDLRAKEDTCQGKKIPPMSDYVDDSLIEEAKNN
jgi:enamine deaminase RidA (YjgF/YER057c/UK114 family)